MVAKLCMLIELFRALGVVWLVEQPANSLLECHPRWQRLISTTRVWKARLEWEQVWGMQIRTCKCCKQ
eukprot:1237042-Alexandrium_andersonii.AAC.1